MKNLEYIWCIFVRRFSLDFNQFFGVLQSENRETDSCIEAI